MKTNS